MQLEYVSLGSAKRAICFSTFREINARNFGTTQVTYGVSILVVVVKARSRPLPGCSVCCRDVQFMSWMVQKCGSKLVAMLVNMCPFISVAREEKVESQKDDAQIVSKQESRSSVVGVATGAEEGDEKGLDEQE